MKSHTSVVRLKMDNNVSRIAISSSFCKAESSVRRRMRLGIGHGGGNWGDVWIGPHKGRRNTVRMFAELGIDMLQMPISFLWEDLNSKDFNAELEYWQDWKKDHDAGTKPKFIAAFRQQHSFDFMKEMFPMIPSAAVPDIAFFMQPFIAFEEPSIGVNSYQAKARQILEGADISYVFTDWGSVNAMLKEQQFPKSPRTRGFDPLVRITQGVRAFSKARIIVTNRLHSSILAFLLNKPHIVIGNTYGNVKGTRDLAFNGLNSCAEDVIQGFYAADMQEAINLVKKILGKA